VCLALLCFVLVGKGVHALQEAAVVPLSLVSFPELPALGIHNSLESLSAQGLLLAVLAWSAVWPRLAARRQRAEPAPAE
jgi:high-affinity Fe2+/Pb2+ permease